MSFAIRLGAGMRGDMRGRAFAISMTLYPPRRRVPSSQGLATDAAKTVHAPDMRALLAPEGAAPVGVVLDEFTPILRTEVARWKKPVDAVGIEAD